MKKIIRTIILLIILSGSYFTSFSQDILSQKDIIGKWQIEYISIPNYYSYDIAKDSFVLKMKNDSKTAEEKVLMNIQEEGIKKSAQKDFIKDGKTQMIIFNTDGTTVSGFTKADFDEGTYSFDEVKQELHILQKANAIGALNVDMKIKVKIENKMLFLEYFNGGNEQKIFSKLRRIE